MHKRSSKNPAPIDEADLVTPTLGRRASAARLAMPALFRRAVLGRHARMLTIILIMLGAALGAAARFALAQWAAAHFGASFPYGTLLINISGSFLLGFIYTILLRANPATAPLARAFLGVGLLGGYTTFSSFSYETSQLLLEGNLRGAIVNPLASVFGGIVVCVLGIALGNLVIGSR
jgi:fluoride exporter